MTAAVWMVGLVAALACEPVPGSEPLLHTGAVVLLGEIHGTVESPEAVGKLACLALDRGLAVTVALEIPRTEQEGVEKFLSDGDRSALLSGEFWSRDYQDGRSSGAMVELLATLRRFQKNESLDVLLIDDPNAANGRDRFMAERLADRIASSPERMVIALTGNLHNRLSLGTPFDPSHEPMGLLLTRLRPHASIISLEMTHGGGSAWICTGSDTSDCGERELHGRGDAPPGIELHDDRDDEPFSGRFHLERITASPPARGLPSR